MTVETMTGLEQAYALIAAGVPVFVARPNPAYLPSKGRTLPDGSDNVEIFLPHKWQDTPADPGTLAEYRPGDALCMVTGHGIDGVDVDTKNGAEVLQQRDRLATLGVTILAEIRTPSGGAHFYVRSAGICSTSQPAAGVDYRGRGLDGSGSGFLYLPGTSRPKYDGAGYEWVRVFDPADLEDLTAQGEHTDAVAAYLSGLGVTVRTRREIAPVAEIGGEPVTFGSLPEWLRLEVADLGPAWPTGPKGEGRPSEDRSERFHHLVAACRRAGLTQGQAVTILDPWCTGVGKYVGRVAQEVARSWPKVEPDNAPSRPSPAQGGQRKDTPGQDSEPVVLEWDTPVPLAAKVAPAVDISGLPQIVQEVVHAYTEQSQSPLEVVLGAALGTLAAATRGAWDVHVQEGWRAGPTSLWVTTLAPSGERKGAGQDPLVEPLRVVERAQAAEVRAANRNRETERKRLARQIKAAEADDDIEKVERLTAALHDARNRPVPLLDVSDTTAEALGQHMTEQGGAAAIFSTEATAFRTVAGAYSDSGGNLGLLNHAYDAEPYSDLRVRRAGVRVDRPTLSWCTAVQPEVLSGYASTDTEGSGFLARFVLFVPESRVGKRSYRTEPVPERIASKWATAVGRLHSVAWRRYAVMTDDLPDELGSPSRITLDAEAADALVVYAERLESAKVPGSDLVSLGGWIEKHPSRLARIAALFALLEDPERYSVPLWAVEAALSLADYLVAHALAAFGILRDARGRDPEARALEALREIGTEEVTTRDVLRKVKGQSSWVESVADVKRVLEGLEALGWVQGPYSRTTGGRPREVWAIHPDLVRRESSEA